MSSRFSSDATHVGRNGSMISYSIITRTQFRPPHILRAPVSILLLWTLSLPVPHFSTSTLTQWLRLMLRLSGDQVNLPSILSMVAYANLLTTKVLHYKMQFLYYLLIVFTLDVFPFDFIYSLCKNVDVLTYKQVKLFQLPTLCCLDVYIGLLRYKVGPVLLGRVLDTCKLLLLNKRCWSPWTLIRA